MRIEAVEAIALEIPLARDFGGSTYSVSRRSTVVTRLRTADGLESEVYNGDNRDHGPEIVRMIRDELASWVRGSSVFEYERIWERMFARTHAARDRKLMMEAIACVDCAVWDLVGKSLGKSVRELLGGHRDRLPIISIGGYYREGKKLDDIAWEMESYRRAGMAGCKFKVGGLSPEDDARRVAPARMAVGPDFLLAVDANRGWSAEDAIRFANLVEPLDIRWFCQRGSPFAVYGYGVRIFSGCTTWSESAIAAKPAASAARASGTYCAGSVNAIDITHFIESSFASGGRSARARATASGHGRALSPG